MVQDDFTTEVQTDTRSLGSGLRGEERFEYLGFDVVLDADAVVADVEFVERIPFFIVRFLNNTQPDATALRGVLHGVRQQIQQNLVQAELVAEDNRNPPVL